MATTWRCLSCRAETQTEPQQATLDPSRRVGQCPVVDCPSKKGTKKIRRHALFERVVPRITQRLMAYTLRAAVDRARKSNRSSDIQMLWLVIDSAPDVARSNHVRERLGKRRCYWLAANDPMGGWL